jgi:hypothetical protein
MGLVNSFGGLVAMRVLVGLFEAGLFPGMLTTHTNRHISDPSRLRLSHIYVLQTLRAPMASYPLLHS